MNQDYVFVSDSPVGNLPNLFLVADGMGGHNAGDFASSHSVQTLVKEISHDENAHAIKIIRHAIEKANSELLACARENEAYYGCGTTMVLCTIVGKYAYIANVGDSRLYLMQDRLRQGTKDHSLVQEMVQRGELSASQARFHPDKNIITRALGAEEMIDIDFFDVELSAGNYILLCSDGLSNMVDDGRIEEIVRETKGSVEAKGRALVNEANANGGKDNIAVVLIEI